MVQYPPLLDDFALGVACDAGALPVVAAAPAGVIAVQVPPKRVMPWPAVVPVLVSPVNV